MLNRKLYCCVLLMFLSFSTACEEVGEESDSQKLGYDGQGLAREEDNKESETTGVGVYLAKAVLYIMDNLAETKYSHGAVIGKTEDGFKLHVDCSYYVSKMLQGFLPDWYKGIPSECRHSTKRDSFDGDHWPLALDYYNFFHGLATGEIENDFWEAVDGIADAEPGDIIAYSLVDEEKLIDRRVETNHVCADPYHPTKLTNEDTGHVMIIMSEPEWVGGDEYRVWVSDSTSVLKGDDNRGAKNGIADRNDFLDKIEWYTGDYIVVDKSGIGIGMMWYETNLDPTLPENKGTDSYHRMRAPDGYKNYNNVRIGRLK